MGFTDTKWIFDNTGPFRLVLSDSKGNDLYRPFNQACKEHVVAHVNPVVKYINWFETLCLVDHISAVTLSIYLYLY